MSLAQLIWTSRLFGLQQLQQKGRKVRGLPPFKLPSGVCEECLRSKQFRDPFPNLYGPITPTSSGGK